MGHLELLQMFVGSKRWGTVSIDQASRTEPGCWPQTALEGQPQEPGSQLRHPPECSRAGSPQGDGADGGWGRSLRNFPAPSKTKEWNISLKSHLWELTEKVSFEVFTAVTTKNAVFSDMTPCDYFKNRRFGRTYRFHLQSDKNRRTRKTLEVTSKLIVTAKVVHSSLILFNLMMEAIRSPESSVLTRATRHHTPEDYILSEKR
jgi:hypothetical protein